ncbi:MAG: cell division protein FtsL [Porticoccaceae bacterium]
MSDQVSARPVRMAAMLWLAVVASAIGVAYTSHLCRQLYSEFALLQRDENRLQVEWGQYLLEQSTWGALGRIERLATDKLVMHVPTASEIVMVRP